MSRYYDEDYIAHFGVSKLAGAKIGSGRYPLGSGKRPRARANIKAKQTKSASDKSKSKKKGLIARYNDYVDRSNKEYESRQIKKIFNSEYKKYKKAERNYKEKPNDKTKKKLKKTMESTAIGIPMFTLPYQYDKSNSKQQMSHYLNRLYDDETEKKAVREFVHSYTTGFKKMGLKSPKEIQDQTIKTYPLTFGNTMIDLTKDPSLWKQITSSQRAARASQQAALNNSRRFQEQVVRDMQEQVARDMQQQMQQQIQEQMQQQIQEQIQQQMMQQQMIQQQMMQQQMMGM